MFTVRLVAPGGNSVHGSAMESSNAYRLGTPYSSSPAAAREKGYCIRPDDHRPFRLIPSFLKRVQDVVRATLPPLFGSGGSGSDPPSDQQYPLSQAKEYSNDGDPQASARGSQYNITIASHAKQ